MRKVNNTIVCPCCGVKIHWLQNENQHDIMASWLPQCSQNRHHPKSARLGHEPFSKTPKPSSDSPYHAKTTIATLLSSNVQDRGDNRQDQGVKRVWRGTCALGISEHLNSPVTNCMEPMIPHIRQYCNSHAEMAITRQP